MATNDNKNKILNKILSPQECFLLKHKMPYILDLKKGNQGLLYMGVEHSRDPKNKQYLQIASLFKKFLRQYSKDSIMLAIEGFVPSAPSSKNDGIVNFGESGLLMHLAQKYQLDYFCPEPSQNEILKYVLNLNLFKKEDIALWIFLNTLWNILKVSPTLSEKEISSLNTLISYLDRQLDSRKSNPNKFYWARFKKRLNEITGGEVLPDNLENLEQKQIDIKIIERLQNPFIEGTVLNNIGSKINYARDRLIAASFIKKITRGENIFSIYGVNHVVAQEPALRLVFMQKKGHIDNINMPYNMEV